MNTRLLRRIKRQIESEPKQFQMRAWYLTSGNIPNCGTAACIGGWAIALAGKITPAEARQETTRLLSIMNKAAKVLDLKSRSQKEKLFAFWSWPLKFQRRAGNNPTQAAARIEHFIETKGME